MAQEIRKVQLGTLEMSVSAPYTNKKGDSRIGMSGKVTLYGVEAIVSITMPATAKLQETVTSKARLVARDRGNHTANNPKVTRLPDARAQGAK